MSHLLFAAAGAAGDFDPNIVYLIVVCVALVVLLVFLFIFFSFVQLWIQSLLAGASVGIFDMVRIVEQQGAADARPERHQQRVLHTLGRAILDFTPGRDIRVVVDHERVIRRGEERLAQRRLEHCRQVG